MFMVPQRPIGGTAFSLDLEEPTQRGRKAVSPLEEEGRFGGGCVLRSNAGRNSLFMLPGFVLFCFVICTFFFFWSNKINHVMDILKIKQGVPIPVQQ